MENKARNGHLCALITIIVWGTTFIATKVLLQVFNPVEILFVRSILALITLFVICPQPMKGTTLKQELTFAGAGFCGIFLYYVLQNVSLTYTLASNAGVIVSVAPFFTVLLSRIFLKEEGKIKARFMLGFVVAMAGIFLISFNGTKMQLNPLGDILVLISAFVWAIYSILTKNISSYGYSTVMTTRKMFVYGTIFLIPCWWIFDCELGLERFADPANIFYFLFLGVGASALCFVSWNYALKVLGAVKTSVYIYLDPVVTVVMSVLILREKITLLSGIGTLLALAGLLISEGKPGKAEE